MNINTVQQPNRATMQRHYSILMKCALIVVSTVLTLLVLEAALRVVFYARGQDIRAYQPSFIYGVGAPHDHSRFTSHPFLPYAPRPFDSRKMYIYRDEIRQVVEYDYATNSLGFRTPERPFEKPSKTKRIVTLGGSTTVDGPTNEQTWPALLEKKLNQHYEKTGYKIEVVNMGVDMAPSPISLVNLEFKGIQYRPDLVISYDGINDLNLVGHQGIAPDYINIMKKYDDSFRTLQSRLPNAAFKSHLISWASYKYDRLLNRRPDLMGQVYKPRDELKISNNPIDDVQYFERNLKVMRAISNEYGAKFLAATAHWVHPPETSIKLNSELRVFFQKEHIDFLDLDALLPHDDWTLHVDQVHWTLKGLEEVAEHWKVKIVMTDSLGLNGEASEK